MSLTELNEAKFIKVKIICGKEPELLDELLKKFAEIIPLNLNHIKSIEDLCVVLTETLKSTFKIFFSLVWFFSLRHLGLLTVMWSYI